MPRIHVEVDDFLDDCSPSDKEEIISHLVEDGLIPEMFRGYGNIRCTSEIDFEDALAKLHGKWNMLSIEEEMRILNLAKKF